MRRVSAADWMWAEALDFLHRAGRLHRQFFRMGAHGTQPAWEPPVDFVESETGLELTVALPGVASADLCVSFDGEALNVRALRPLSIRTRSRIHSLEIPYGRFERRVPVPAGSYAALEQTYADGCLYLHLRKVSPHP